MQHAKTFALCVAIAIAAYLVGASTMEARGPANPNFILHVQVEGIPSPQQMMRVVEGTPFTVPDRKVFVVTGVGSPNNDAEDVRLYIDGLQVLQSAHTTSGENGTTTLRPVPAGLAVLEGETVSVDGGGQSTAIILGYLVGR